MNPGGPDGIPSAFAVVVARPGRSLPPDLADRIDPGLWFTPDSRQRWTDDSGRTLVVAWQRRGPGSGDRWRLADGDLVVSSGRLRRLGTRWSTPGSWADDLAGRLREERVEDIVDSLVGGFQFLTLDRSGCGTLAGDALGMAFTYHGSNEEFDVLSSEASLAAGVLAGPGSVPTRDAVASCWLTYAPYHIGLQTGYADVSLLREGSIVRFGEGAPRIEGRPAPWLTPGPLLGLSRDELLDHIITAVTDELEAALRIDADERIIDLTGGKDSRLLLAVALLAGLADRFTFTTFGPEPLGDVKVARQIARRFDLDHHWGLDRLAVDADPYPDRVRSFNASMACMVSIWHARGPGPPTGRVRVSGNFAEILRTHQPVAGPVPDTTLLASRQVSRLEARAMPLLRRDIIERLSTMARAEFGDDPVGASAPLDLLETFFARNRARKFWGPLLTMERDQRIWPLISLDSVRAAFALGGEDRQAERVHFEIMRRASPDLVRVPFVGRGWSPDLTGQTPRDSSSSDTSGDASEGRLPGVAPPPSGGDESLIALFRRASTDDRDDFIREIVGDHANPAWEMIDRPATADALARWGDLPSRHRQQVYGALTAALWLG